MPRGASVYIVSVVTLVAYVLVVQGPVCLTRFRLSFFDCGAACVGVCVPPAAAPIEPRLPRRRLGPRQAGVDHPVENKLQCALVHVFFFSLFLSFFFPKEGKKKKKTFLFLFLIASFPKAARDVQGPHLHSGAAGPADGRSLCAVSRRCLSRPCHRGRHRQQPLFCASNGERERCARGCGDGIADCSPTHHTGTRAFLGMGFQDRSDAFDFVVSLQDHFKYASPP